MSTTDYDLIVIGTGPSASTVARKARKQGRSVAIVEAREFGGECALRGCNPKKVYANAGALMAQVRGARGKLIETDDAHINWKHLVDFKREFTDYIPEKSRKSFESAGIDTIQGMAEFSGPQTIKVGDRELSAERFFVGVGARPAPLDFPGAEYAIHSDAFMELEEMPQRVAFIGGGYISLEFAHVVARFGSDTTVLDRNDHILKGFDADLTEQLASYSRKQGMRVETNASVTRIESGDDLRLFYQKNGEERSVGCDLVIHGAGRVPHLKPLCLDRAEVSASEDGIEVDDFLRSKTNHRIFAGGDCAATGQPKLTPTANEEARAVHNNLFDPSPSTRPDYGVIPRVAFTTPCIASVGLSEADARKQHADLTVSSGESSDWNSMRKSGIECAGYKVLVDGEDRIVGAHLLGHAAEETINLFALAMKFGLKAKDLKSTLFAFPTFSSDIRNMV